jgi:hypothetical protein
MTNSANDVFLARTHLATLPDRAYFDHHQQPVRHPLAVYNLSLSKLGARFESLTEALPAKLSTSDFHASWPEISSRIEALLSAFEAHAESCRTIIHSADPSFARAREKCFGRMLRGALDELVSRRVNLVKHQSHQVQPVSATSSTASVRGYFLCSANAGGVVGPSNRVHKAGSFGFSFAISLRQLIRLLITTDDALASALGAGTSPKQVRRLADEPADRSFINAAQWLASVPPYCFPDEVSVPMTRIEVLGTQVSIRLDSLQRFRSIAEFGCKVAAQFPGDGVSRTFQLPGWGRPT